MTRIVFWLACVLLAFLAWERWQGREIVHAPGVLVESAPSQVDVAEGRRFALGEYALTERARFEISARVLSVEPYWLDRGANISPLDLALGWGVMSDQAVLDHIEISQSARWYRTRYAFPAPLSDRQIIVHSSNMHMVPASRRIEKRLEALRVGDVVRLRGSLVDIDHPSGWRWRTSLSRADTGDGACEIVYVEQVERITPPR